MKFLKKNYKFILILIVVFCFGWFLPNPKIKMPNNTEKRIMVQSEKYIAKINEYFKDNNINIVLSINDIQKIKEDTTAGYNFIQYGILFNDSQDFISFIYDKDTGKIIAAFVNEMHIIDTEAYAKDSFMSLVLAIDDNLTSEQEDIILEKVNNDEMYFSNDDITFYMYKNDLSQNDIYNDTYDYEITYEIDLFKNSGDDLNEES